MFFHRNEYTNWLSNIKWSDLKTWKQVTLHGLPNLFMYLKIHVYVNNDEGKSSWIWKRASKSIWKDLEGEKKKKNWCDYIVIPNNKINNELIIAIWLDRCPMDREFIFVVYHHFLYIHWALEKNDKDVPVKAHHTDILEFWTLLSLCIHCYSQQWKAFLPRVWEQHKYMGITINI